MAGLRHGSATVRQAPGRSQAVTCTLHVSWDERLASYDFGPEHPLAPIRVKLTIELARAAEDIGVDGAFVRVHHFERQLSSPIPLLSAIAARTSRIEIGTAVIDMRYENPLYLAEEAAAADLISGGRLQLGVSRGSPEIALRGAESFGYRPADGETDADSARGKTEIFLAAITGAPVARTDPARAAELLARAQTLVDQRWARLAAQAAG